MTTKGIRVSVTPRFEMDYSDTSNDKYVFAYRVVIENRSAKPVQLMARHWKIFDMGGIVREVKGEGVVGQQPVLQPGESHEYESWCPLTAPVGYMEGSYLMHDMVEDKNFEAAIPRFELVAPFAMN